MAYSRLLILGEKEQEELIQSIDRFLQDHEGERDGHIQQLKNWQYDYWAEPILEDKNFPIANACKIIIPLTAITVETNHAALMGTLYPDNGQVISVKPKLSDISEIAPVAERFLNEQLLTHIQLKESMESSYLELEKFGTGVAKSQYTKVTKYGIREIDGVETEFPVLVKNTVEITPVPLGNFWMRFHEQDPQFAEWVGEVHEFTDHRLKMAIRDGLFYDDLLEESEDQVMEHTRTGDSEVDTKENQELLEGREPTNPSSISIWELWGAFDTDGTDVPKEIQVFYWKEKRKICAIRYNQSPKLARPYRSGVYMKVEHRWHGIGLCKMTEQFQLEVTIQHRQRIDNATIANVRMFKVAKMSGYGPNEPVFPGKMWFLDDMADIEPMQLGEVYPSSYNNESQTLMYSQQRTGVNEMTMGMSAVGTPNTATSDMSRLQEAKKRFDYVVSNVRKFTLDVALDALDLVKIYGPKTTSFSMSPMENQIINAILAAPVESFRDMLMFDIKMITSQQNKVLERNNWTQLTGFTQQYYMQMLQLAMQSGNQQLAQMLMQKALTGATEMISQIYETFDVRNIERIIPIQEMMMLMQGGQMGQLPPGAPPTGNGNAPSEPPVAG